MKMIIIIGISFNVYQIRNSEKWKVWQIKDQSSEKGGNKAMKEVEPILSSQ